MKILSKPEEFILLTVWKLGEDAYGVTIRNHIIRETGVEWSIGSIYVPLSRLTQGGYLESIVGEPTSQRGGKRKKYYRLTVLGLKALAYIKKVNESMWDQLPDPEKEANFL